MDLEEFLMENGIASLPGVESPKGSPDGSDTEEAAAAAPKVALLPSDELDVCQKGVVTIDSDIICDVTTGKIRNLEGVASASRLRLTPVFACVVQR